MPWHFTWFGGQVALISAPRVVQADDAADYRETCLGPELLIGPGDSWLVMDLAMKDSKLRRTAKRVLRKLGVSRSVIRRIPTERAVWRWLEDALPAELSARDACGFNLELVDDTLFVSGNGGYCADGGYVEFRARIGKKRWKLLEAEAAHFGRP